MDAPLDLYRASREELIALVLRQREQILDLEQEMARLRAEVATQRAEMTRLTDRVGALLAALEGPPGDEGSPRPTTMPGLKRAATRRPSTPPRARHRRPHGYGRKRMRPTARQVHAYATCPQCRTALHGGTVRRTREVL